MYSMSPAGVESGPSWYTVVSYYWLLTTAMYNMSYYNIPLLLSNYMYQHTHTHTHARTHTHTHTHAHTHTHTHTQTANRTRHSNDAIHHLCLLHRLRGSLLRWLWVTWQNMRSGRFLHRGCCAHHLLRLLFIASCCTCSFCFLCATNIYNALCLGINLGINCHRKRKKL